MAGDDAKCSDEVNDGTYFMAGVMAVTGLMATVLALSGVFHCALRRLGQPSIISHILAGVVVGPTVLGRAVDLRQLGMEDAGSALSDTIYFVRIVFMFFIGLEMDHRYLRHHLRRSLALACGGSGLCLLLAALAGPFFYGLLHPGQGPFQPDKLYASTALFMLVLTTTASPVLIRIVTELKLTGSEAGQLAIGAAFANDMASLTVFSIMVSGTTAYGPDGQPTPAFPPASIVLSMALTAWLAVILAARAARLLNRLKRGRRYVSKYELCSMLVLIVGLSLLEQVFGYSASMTAFLIGLAMPRDGPTARTLIDRLTYPVHQLVMPLCFGAIGARLDFAAVGSFTAAQFAVAVAFTTLLGAAGKVGGTVLAGRLLGISARESLVLGFLLNVKGYCDILAINFGNESGIWGETAQVVLLLSSILNTFMAGPASAAIVRQQRRASRYRSRCLQDLKVDHELRVLACVHGARGVHAMLTLAELSKGTAPLAVYLLHLVELMAARKYAITHLYHDPDDDEWGYAREIEQVAAAVNAFTYDSAVPVRQMTAISSLSSMDADVRNGIEDSRASLVIIPFHKEQRYDGRMVCRREGRRQLNQRVLQRAPCTIGILVERRLLAGDVIDVGAAEAVSHVVAVFLGGPDDREAVAYATRLAAHPSVSVTVVRFLPARAGTKDDEEDGGTKSRARALRPCGGAMAVSEDDEEASMADEEFMADVYARLVVPGHVEYTERYVSNGAETVNSLSSMMRAYSLFVVGKGGGAAGMTSGMGGLLEEECPELGPVGEVLASDDFTVCASVLVLHQQHSAPYRHPQIVNIASSSSSPILPRHARTHA
ncbi:hypothetical protein E2562_025607 [Oryza meyeriana var. granulata]|uniref:Uncharacterized protein n=1 Tax=Oryza meyeriana var. granulata TaxID=110450 RepID=A0A6G1FCC1_9ORYZ|nr:hypothetical protein E2562_025607 [Oryza meyeriana var. granulata]